MNHLRTAGRPLYACAMRPRRAGRLPHNGDIELLRHAVVHAPGAAERDIRRAAYEGDWLPPPLGPFLDKVRDDPVAVTDADVEALRAAGYSEDAILELTAAAAVGAAGRRYDVGLRALRGEL